MNPYTTLGLLAGVAIIQSSLIARVDAFGTRPDFMLIAVISWSLLRGSREGAAWGFIGGLMQDLLSGTPAGLNALYLCLVGYLAGLGEAKLFRTNYVLPITIISGLSLTYFVALVAALHWLGLVFSWTDALIRLGLPTLGLNLLITPLVYPSLRWLSVRTGREQLGW